MNTIQWEVASILSERVIAGITRYEVKWVGYEETTFERVENLNDCNDKLQAYLKKKSENEVNTF